MWKQGGGLAGTLRSLDSLEINVATAGLRGLALF